jgi:hypothetical protein
MTQLLEKLKRKKKETAGRDDEYDNILYYKIPIKV